MSDLIDRNDAIDVFEILADKMSDAGQTVMAQAVAVLKDLRSAEPERKNGEWTGDCCSCCGVSKYNYIKMVDDECGPFGTWNFCPNCGADMRGE